MSIDINDIVLTVEQKTHLAQLADRTGRSPSELLSQFFQQHPLLASKVNGNETERTLYDAFSEDGSVGLIKDGPDDVSVNPMYMEGFGRSGF